MHARTFAVVAVAVLTVLGGGVALAPSAAATHNCGWDLPCPHPDDLFCLPIVKKYLGFLCPYG